MEFIFTFLAAVLSSYITVAFLALIAIMCEASDNRVGSGYAATFMLLILSIALSPSWTAIAITLACWIPVGLVWSLFRWKSHCTEIGKVAKEAIDNNSSYSLGNDRSWSETINGKDIEAKIDSIKRDVKNKVDITKNKDTVVYWIIFWPTSMVSNIIKDIYEELRILVSKRLRSVFDSIANKATKDL